MTTLREFYFDVFYTPYHKIQTIYLRDPETKHKTLLHGQFARPEFLWLEYNLWVFTEKIDGTNIRVMWSKEDGVSFGGKSDNSQIPAILVNKLNEMFNPGIFEKQFDADAKVTLYGEGYGAKIQKGGGNYIPNGVDFILFDVTVQGTWLERHNVTDVADGLGIKAVPVINEGPLSDAVHIVEEGFSSQVAESECIAEGLVMRPKVELLDRFGHRIITKIKHKDFPR